MHFQRYFAIYMLTGFAIILVNTNAKLCHSSMHFTGCDTTSQFHGKAKKSTWEAWKSYSSTTKAFQFVMTSPFQQLQLTSPTFELLERFTCVLYDKTTATSQVNELRQDLFSKKAKLIESIH